MSLPDPTEADRDDARLAALLRADPLPEPPARLAADVRRRVRRHRRQRAGAVVAAAVLVVGLVAWWEWPRTAAPGPVAGRPVPPAADDLADVALLFAPPPVDPLDQLARQQTGYVTAMQRMK